MIGAGLVAQKAVANGDCKVPPHRQDLPGAGLQGRSMTISNAAGLTPYLRGPWLPSPSRTDARPASATAARCILPSKSSSWITTSTWRRCCPATGTSKPGSISASNRIFWPLPCWSWPFRPGRPNRCGSGHRTGRPGPQRHSRSILPTSGPSSQEIRALTRCPCQSKIFIRNAVRRGFSMETNSGTVWTCHREYDL